MPLYDYNGTNNCEIGKVYDYNGTNNHQIGKIYDYNGTDNALIYSAEETLFSGVSVQTGIAGGSGAEAIPYESKTAYSSTVNVSVNGFTQITITGKAASVVTHTGEYTTYGGQVYLAVCLNGTWNNQYKLLASTSGENHAGTYEVNINTTVDISSIASQITAVRLYLWCQCANSYTTARLYVRATNVAAVVK